MTDSYTKLRQRLNEMQAVRGVDADTRNLIGVLSETIDAFEEEIDDLRQRVAELEEMVDENQREEDRDRTWYSER